MKRYKHLFFDLDHTLWDFRANSRETLRELHRDLDLAFHGVDDVDELIGTYEEVNAGLWKRYESGHLDKAVLRVLRFRNTLLKFGVKNEKLSVRMGREFLEKCPRKGMLNAGALELLTDLHAHYPLHVITNGFSEVQGIKLECSGIDHFFQVVLTSEQAGASKPDARIFTEALKRAGAQAGDSLMIGDSAEADTAGARNAGWDQVHYVDGSEPDALATHRITHLRELRPLLL